MKKRCLDRLSRILNKLRIIGFLSEGDSEEYLEPVIAQIKVADSVRLITKPRKVKVHPTSEPAQIVAGVRKMLPFLTAKGANEAILMLDRETAEACASEIASDITAAMLRGGLPEGITTFQTVLKDRALENWLISDHEAVCSMPKAFALAANVRKRLRTDDVDQLDASAILQAATERQYENDKPSYAKKILSKADPYRIAAGSRSFRRLLRVSGDTVYSEQSKKRAK